MLDRWDRTTNTPCAWRSKLFCLCCVCVCELRFLSGSRKESPSFVSLSVAISNSRRETKLCRDKKSRHILFFRAQNNKSVLHYYCLSSPVEPLKLSHGLSRVGPKQFWSQSPGSLNQTGIEIVGNYELRKEQERRFKWQYALGDQSYR